MPPLLFLPSPIALLLPSSSSSLKLSDDDFLLLLFLPPLIILPLLFFDVLRNCAGDEEWRRGDESTGLSTGAGCTASGGEIRGGKDATFPNE